MAVTVIPLVWTESNEGYAKGQSFANSMFGEYYTHMHIPSAKAWLKGPDIAEFHDTIDAAKAAAQEDYRTRVLSAIDESADSPDKAFSDWLNSGPALARAAGCHVGIKVTAAPSQPQKGETP